jgi:hypothetical protein
VFLVFCVSVSNALDLLPLLDPPDTRRLSEPFSERASGGLCPALGKISLFGLEYGVDVAQQRMRMRGERHRELQYPANQAIINKYSTYDKRAWYLHYRILKKNPGSSSPSL